MKKLLLAGALAVFGLSGAQIQQGNWMVGAQVANFKFTNGFNMNLTPKLGYFIQDRWAVGAEVCLNVYSPEGSGDTQTTWHVGPFTRYYFSSTEVDSMLRNGAFFGEGSVGFGGDNSSAGNSTNGVNLGIGAGYAYFLTPNVGLEGLLKFQALAGGGNKNANGNLFLGVGFQIYLPTSRASAVLQDQQ